MSWYIKCLGYERQIGKKQSTFEVIIDTNKVIAVESNKTVAILTIESLGHYKSKQGVLQLRLNKYFTFESLDTIFEGYSSTNWLKSGDPYPQFEANDSIKQWWTGKL